MRHPTRHCRKARRCRDTYFRSTAPYNCRREACLRPDRESRSQCGPGHLRGWEVRPRAGAMMYAGRGIQLKQGTKTNRCYLVYRRAGRWRARSQMTDLHQVRAPNPNAEIDAVGWLFSALVALIIAVAALIAYEANDTMVSSAPVSHVVAR